MSGVASAVCQRKVVGLSNSGLRVEQVEAILANLQTSNLHSLTLAGLNLTQVDEPFHYPQFLSLPGGAFLV